MTWIQLSFNLIMEKESFYIHFNLFALVYILQKFSNYLNDEKHNHTRWLYSETATIPIAFTHKFLKDISIYS